MQFDAHLLAALVGGAPGVVAQESVGSVDGSVVVGARVVRAEGFTALLFLALAVVTFHVMGVFDWSVAVGAADGVAVQRLYVFVRFVLFCTTRNGSQVRMGYGLFKRCSLGVVRSIMSKAQNA